MQGPSSRPTPTSLAWILPMAALIALGAYLNFPLGPVPLSLQTLFVMLGGLMLGPVHGALAATLYGVAGALGLPVFAGGSAGLDVLLGPTGGFLISFIPMAAIMGLAIRGGQSTLSWRRGIVWGAAASAVPFLIGLPWLQLAADLTWSKTLDAGFFPFLPGAVLKLLLCLGIYRFLARRGLLPHSRT